MTNLKLLLMSFLDWGGGKLQNWFENGGDDGCYLWFAPYSTVALFVLFTHRIRTIEAESFLDNVFVGVRTAVLVLVSMAVANLFSSFFMRILLKSRIFTMFFEKVSVYEKVQDKYYLKDTKTEVRHLFQTFDKKLTVGAVMVYSILQSINKTKNHKWLLTLSEMLALWAVMKAVYLSSRTYKEELRWNSKKQEKTGWTNRDTNFLKNQLLNKAMPFYANFIRGNSIVYPVKADICKKYGDIYENLSNDRSVLITDAFYHDWERAFFIPVHRFLLHDRKVIILAGANMDPENLRNWVRNELEHLLGIKENWRTKIWIPGCNNWDIVVVPYEQIPFFAYEMKKSRHFWGVFTFALEPSRMIMEMKDYLELLSESFGCMKEKPVYCFADMHFYGLADTLSHIFGVKIHGIAIDWEKSLSICSYGIDETVQSEAFKYWGTKDYWGNGSVVMSELSKRGETFTYCSQGTVPVRDIKNALKGKLLSSAGSNDEIKVMEDCLDRCVFEGSFWKLDRQQDLNIIVCDEWCNFFRITDLLSSRAMEQSRIFVLSETYILRDFLWDKASRHLFTESFVPVFVPIYQDTKRNKMIKVVISGYQSPIQAETMEEELPFHLISRNCDAVFCRKNKDEWFFDKTFLEENEWWLEDVYFVDEAKNTEPFGCRKLGHIYQKYLPGQFITLHGSYYRFSRVEKRNGHLVMRLSRSSSLVQQPFRYQQCRTYFMGESRHEKTVRKDTRVEMKWYSGNIIVTTEGYYEAEKWNWTGDCDDVEERFVQVEIPRRKYQQKRWIHLEIRNQENEGLYEALAILLTEIAKTIFPFHYQYLAIIPFHGSQNGEGILYQVRQRKFNTGLCIIEDCMEDMGILEVFEAHFAKIMDLCKEYCSWAVAKNVLFVRRDGWEDSLNELYKFFGSKESVQEGKTAVDEASATYTMPRKRSDRSMRGSVCICCGAEIQRSKHWNRKRYCMRCINSVQSEEVYYNKLSECKNWLKNVMGIPCTIKPKIHRRWFSGGYIWKQPAEGYGELLLFIITCKKHMDRDFINPHLIFAYIGLWYCDNFKKCTDYMKDYKKTYRKRILQTWFQIQYLYLNVSKEEAQRLENQAVQETWGNELVQFFDKHPIIKDKVLSEWDLKRLTEENPIAKILDIEVENDLRIILESKKS